MSGKPRARRARCTLSRSGDTPALHNPLPVRVGTVYLYRPAHLTGSFPSAFAGTPSRGPAPLTCKPEERTLWTQKTSGVSKLWPVSTPELTPDRRKLGDALAALPQWEKVERKSQRWEVVTGAKMMRCPCTVWGWREKGLCEETHTGPVRAGASPTRLELTIRIRSVWLTCRPSPRLRAPVMEIRLFLQQERHTDHS